MAITKEQKLNQLTSALEGGSNYWYFLPDTTMIPKAKDVPLVERLFSAIYKDKTLQVPVNDVEDENEELGFISYENIKRADELLKTDKYKWIEKDIRDENDDASTGDCWLQLVVMGEIVYG